MSEGTSPLGLGIDVAPWSRGESHRSRLHCVWTGNGQTPRAAEDIEAGDGHVQFLTHSRLVLRGRVGAR